MALSMSTLLSDCGLKVLLVDCDLSTNGATYFYEDRLATQKNILTFYNIILGEVLQSAEIININKNMDFIPSIAKISKKVTGMYLWQPEDEVNILNMMTIFKNYNAVIFDCQAGYTDTLKLILPVTDINLVVMESDAISSSSIRSLYLKIGDILKDNKIYQIFNKATDDEYQIYSKVSGGTVFTNIETVKFDWKIRNAFTVAETPDMKTTSANYGEQIYNICRILLKEEYIQSRINKYKIIVEMNKYNEKEKELDSKLRLLKKEKSDSKKMRGKFFSQIGAVISVMLCISSLGVMYSNKILQEELTYPIIFLLIAVYLSIVPSIFAIVDTIKEIKNQEDKFSSYRRCYDDIDEKKQKLQEQYEKTFNEEKSMNKANMD